MYRYSPGVRFRVLLPVIFLSILICRGYSSPDCSQHIDKNQLKDSLKVRVQPAKKPVQALKKDTLQTHKKDTLPTQKKDTLQAQKKDSLNLQPQDTVAGELPDSVLLKKSTFTAEELIRGERLFYGLAYLKDKSVNCAECHNTRVSDTLNWNPDAVEISVKYSSKGSDDLKKVLLKPLGVKMKQVHKGFQLSTEDIVLIKAFMNKLPAIGLKQDKPVITYLLLLVIAAVLFLISTADLIIKKIFKRKWFRWTVISVTGIFITTILAINAVEFGRARGFTPEQPIKFSHFVHAGQNKIDCNYCHYSAKSGKSSGIPPGSVCYNCHFLVRTGTRSGVTEIAKVLYAYDKKIAVPWVRIYKLPDFVFFSHAQHVTAGEVNCVECHGKVQEMHRLSQVPDLSMGWCIKCHDTKKVKLSNTYYKTYYPEIYDYLKSGTADSLAVTDVGGRNCGRCHY